MSPKDRLMPVHGQVGRGLGEAGVVADLAVVHPLEPHPERGDLRGLTHSSSSRHSSSRPWAQARQASFSGVSPPSSSMP